MNPHLGILIYIGLGTLGGLAGAKLKIPAGSMIMAMLTLIVFKLFTKSHWEVPKGFIFFLQVFAGIMVGASFQPAMLPVLKKLFLPVLVSTLTLVGTGMLLAILFTRMNILDASSAYIGTSPGAMNALIVLAFDSGASATLVVCFHFFRVVFVILTAPLFLKFFSH
jgi:membrane AbrB-like protein